MFKNVWKSLPIVGLVVAASIVITYIFEEWEEGGEPEKNG